MLPPVLEVYVVWHPRDTAGRQIAEEIVEHFHGTLFSGLIGGAIEVYVRSGGWRADTDAPRPLPLRANVLPPAVRQAMFTAVVPILGNELAAAVQQDASAWQTYIRAIAAAQASAPHRVGVFPYQLDRRVVNQTVLGEVLSPFQCIGASAIGAGETLKSARCRDLSQAVAQFLGKDRLTVFISHTTRKSSGEARDVQALIATVREAIRSSRLREFFDASDLQPGQDWDRELRNKAATSALLAIRTDLYPSREWCQREMLIAKREGMPVIIMDALGDAEERGSFLMDHVPRVAVRMVEGHWRKVDVHRGLNLLVDECLKRVLWGHQANLAERERGALKVTWWAPHAPEPITLSNWLEGARVAGRLPSRGKDILILHPDPPLGADEKLVLQEMLRLAGIKNRLDVMTPRILAARSG